MKTENELQSGYADMRMNYVSAKKNYDLKWIIENIDTDYIEENPHIVYDILDYLYKEYTHSKEYIQFQNESILLLQAMIESKKEHYIDNDDEILSDWT